MRKIAVTPDKAGYSTDDTGSVISTKVASGANRYRRDMFGARVNVNVQWTCDPEEYQYLRLFYRTAVDEGSLPFLIELVLDHADITEHEAYFIPGTFKLSSHSGLTFIVNAQLDIKPKATTQADFDFTVIFENFGPYFAPYEDLLDKITNVTLPEDLPYG